MAGVSEINVVRVTRDWEFSGLGIFETPTGLYSIENTPSWASGDGFNDYSYVRRDENPTGADPYTATNWAITLSGQNKFYWQFSGDNANYTEIYLTGHNKESKQDIYLPTGWSTSGSNISIRAYIDDDTYNSGIFKNGVSDLSYKITGLSVDFEPANQSLVNANYADARAFSVTVKNNFNDNNFVYYVGSGLVDSIEMQSGEYFQYADSNPILISIGDTEGFMEEADQLFSLNSSKRLYITRSNNGNPSGSFSEHYNLSSSSSSGNLTGSMDPDNLLIKINGYGRNAASGSIGHITGLYKLKEYFAHSRNSSQSKIYENASGSLIRANRPCCGYDVSSWELVAPASSTAVPEYLTAATSSSNSDTIPVSGLWSLNSSIVNNASTQAFGGSDIQIMCTGGECGHKDYRPEGSENYFSIQTPEAFRRYKLPNPTPDYCDLYSISGWDFTSGDLSVNLYDYYIFMAAMPLWEEYQTRIHRAGLVLSERSAGASSNSVRYPSSSESGYGMDETYFFSGGRKLLKTNIETNISGGTSNWTGMNFSTNKTLITGLDKAGIITFNNLESSHGKYSTNKTILGNSPEVDFPDGLRGKSLLSMDPNSGLYFIHVNKDL
jgi:hypothetical protein